MAVDALEGLEGVCWGMGGEGKCRPGGGGNWLPTLPCCQEHVCVLLGSVFFFLSPFNESNPGPMQSGPPESWPPKTWRPP